MDRSIEIIARGVLVRDGCILLCHNRRKRNTFLPGGHVEFGEGARAALKREIEEETGLPTTVGRFLGASEHTFRYKGERVCEVNLVFELNIRGARASRPVPAAESKLEFSWCPLAKLGRSGMEPSSLRKDLPAWLKKRPPSRWSSSYT